MRLMTNMFFCSVVMACVLFVSSCDDEDQSMIVDTNITLSFVDEQGNDLLNTEVDEPIESDKIDLYKFLDGKKEQVNSANLDYPSGFMVYRDENMSRNMLEVLPSQFSQGAGTFEVLIDFDGAQGDMLKYEIEKTGRSEKVVKVWYNDELKWKEGEGRRYIEIVK